MKDVSNFEVMYTNIVCNMADSEDHACPKTATITLIRMT